MYMGRVVEHGPTESVIHRPQHPYTCILLSAIPPLQAGPEFHMDKLEPRSYEVPNLANVGVDCAFAVRCPFADAQCQTETPECIMTRQISLSGNEWQVTGWYTKQWRVG